VNRRDWHQLPITVLKPGQRFAFKLWVIEDRIRDHAELDAKWRALHGLLHAEQGAARRSPIWTTQHYARQGRERYLETCGDKASPELLALLENPRSMVLVVWCVTAKPLPTAGTAS
jgi:hypothetical protein